MRKPKNRPTIAIPSLYEHILICEKKLPLVIFDPPNQKYKNKIPYFCSAATEQKKKQ